MKKLILIILFISQAGFAADRVNVLGLFSGKAYLSIAGENHLFVVGDSFRGITLIQSTGKWAKIKNEKGEINEISIGGQINNSYKKPPKKELKIKADEGGMFQVNGHINNTPLAFLVDTGATSVAMSERHAKKLGIKYKQKKNQSQAQTASGIATTWNVVLDSVDIGGMKASFVPAAVIAGNHPYQVLLGMSYLKNFKVQQNNGVMLLKRKY